MWETNWNLSHSLVNSVKFMNESVQNMNDPLIQICELDWLCLLLRKTVSNEWSVYWSSSQVKRSLEGQCITSEDVEYATWDI